MQNDRRLRELFKHKEDELNRQISLEVPSASIAEEAASLNDAVEVVQWYQFQIYIKLTRAIDGQMREQTEDFEEIEDFPKDSDGSAKVALIGIDRSIAAWSMLWKYFPDEEDSILAILVQLERLRREAERRFPNARAFVRPGFDESLSNN